MTKHRSKITIYSSTVLKCTVAIIKQMETGTVTYQFVVDDPSLSEGGIVTVRFQEDEEGRNYDPSIADTCLDNAVCERRRSVKCCRY